MKSLFLALAILTAMLSSTSFARITDQQAQIKVIEKKIEISVNPGFHLNAEAPASAQFNDLKSDIKPKSKTEKLITFLAPDGAKTAKLRFYVCDDKKTACELHEEEVSLIKTKADGPATSAEVRKTFNMASLKSGHPTLLMFSAPWCPACIRMKTETYTQKTVQQELKKVTQQQVNIDLPENYELAEKFHVKAIPTAILISKDGEEVKRWLDFQPAKTYASELHQSMKTFITTMSLEKSAKSGNEKAITELGMRAYKSVNCEEAIQWLSLSKNNTNKNYKLASEVTCAEEKAANGKQNEIISALEKSSALSTSVIDQTRWTVDLLEKLKDQQADMRPILWKAEIVVEKIENLLKQPRQVKSFFAQSTFGDTGGFETEELYLMKSRVHEAFSNKTESDKAKQKIIQLITKRKISTAKPGEELMAIGYLRNAGETAQVEKWYQELISSNPKTYVYFEKYARYLLKQKNYSTALNNINQALPYAEGNEPQLFLLKAKILKEMKNNVAARETLIEALKVENISHKKYKKVLAQVEDLKGQLATDHVQD